MIPTRWRVRLDDQLAQAEARVASAEQHAVRGNGGGALQAAYQSVVDAATIRVWLATHPWEVTLSPDEMQTRVRDAFPNLFAALSELDLATALTSPWTPEAAEPYVAEARSYVGATAKELRRWLHAD